MLFRQMDVKYKLIPGLYGKLVYLLTSFYSSYNLLPLFPIRCYVLRYSLHFVLSDQLKTREYWNLGRMVRSCLKFLQSLALIPAERYIIDAFQIIIKHLLCLQASYRRTDCAPGRISFFF